MRFENFKNQDGGTHASMRTVPIIKMILKRLLPPKTPEERARRQFFAIKLTQDDVAIDCGANVGDITWHLSRSGATVYAFEPNPFAFRILNRRLSNRHNVHCIQKGVFHQNGTQKLYLHQLSEEDEVKWSTGSSLLDSKGNVLKDKFVEVPVIDLNEFIMSLNSRVKVLKMDVEGVECSIIKKLVTTGVIERVDYLFVETHDHKITELKSETEELREIVRAMNLKNVNLDWR